MSLNTIDFLSKPCKNGKHSECHGSWAGLGFRCNCDCICHKRKNQVTVGVREPASVAIDTSSSEDSKEDD